MDVPAVDWTFVRQRTRWLVPAGFVGLSLVVVWKYVLTQSWIGIDASLYAAASAAWMAGADPWAVNQDGIYFAAPPPTLLAFAAFAWMPPLAVSLLWISGSVVLAVLAVRTLRLPLWWIAFPPIVDAALVGNPDVAVLASLIVAGGRFGPIAPFLKIYALVPMVGERRWRQLGVSLVLLAVASLVLPWASWVSRLPVITAHLVETSASTSVFGQPVLMAIGLVALLGVGLRRAGWLAVPLLWPYTQFHYAAIAVPGLAPFLALAWCYPTPEAWLASTCGFAIYLRVTARTRPGGPADPDTRAYRAGATRIDPSSSE